MRKRHKTRYPGIYYRLLDETRPEGPRRYIVWYSDSEGTQRTKTLPLEATLEDAQLERASLNIRKANGETLVRPRLTVGGMLDAHLGDLEERLDETTISTHRVGVDLLKKEFGTKLVGKLTPTDIARWIRKMERNKAASTVRRYLAPLSSAYRVAVRDGLVQSSPVDKLLPHERAKGEQAKGRCLSTEEIEKLLGATRSQNGKGEHLRWKTLFTLLVFTGLRISEALALTWEDITEEGVVVRESKTLAGRRTVMLIPALRRMLTELRLSNPTGSTFVFVTQEGAPLGRRNALTALKACCRRAGIPEYTLHELRHTFASILIAQRELPTLVAKQMGHKDPGVTMSTYAHLFEEQASVDLARDRLQETMGGMV